MTAPLNHGKQNRAGRGFGGFGAGWPYLWGGYDYGDGGYEEAQTQPSVVLVMPDSQAEARPALQPPPPVRPEIHEYQHPEQEPQAAGAFTIVGTDGRGYPAAAVWVQGNTLHFVTPDGEGRTLPLASVNREATRAANARDGLSLRIPAPGS
jgi:hypothetical protein